MCQKKMSFDFESIKEYIMRIQVKGGFFRFTEKESLKENEDLQIVGYFKDNSLLEKYQISINQYI